MAKDNMFLGFARGKVGDVVFYRQHGTQISRARNRRPANPNTLKQQIQRSVAASVQRLYSVGKQIFDHSFEGVKVGMQNQMLFSRRNIAILRALVIDDLNLGRMGADCRARVSAPGLSVAVPFDGMQISGGSYDQLQWSWDSQEGKFGLALSPVLNTETVAQFCQRANLVPGDIYTFVVIGNDPIEGSELAYFGPEDYDQYAAVFASVFNFAQMRVKAGVLSDDTVFLSNTTYAAVFEPAEIGTDLTTLVFGTAVGGQEVDVRAASYCLGCIRSREDTGVRSTSFMHVGRGIYDWGLSSDWLSAAWAASVKLDGADLILDGRDFAPAKPAGMVLTPDFEFPIGAAALSGKTIAFSRAVTYDDLLNHLSLTYENLDVQGHASVEHTGADYYLYDGTDRFNSLTLAADGMSVTFGSAAADPDFTAVRWR